MQNELQHYELTFIIPGNLSEDQHPEILNKVNALLTQKGAKITSQEDFGRRKLAYPINHLRHGFYRTIIFDLVQSQLREIKTELKLNQNILRFLCLKIYPQTVKDIAAQEKVKAKRVKEKLAEKVKAEEEKKEKTKKKKISLEDLDKKLDELLDEKIL